MLLFDDDFNTIDNPFDNQDNSLENFEFHNDYEPTIEQTFVGEIDKIFDENDVRDIEREISEPNSKNLGVSFSCDDCSGSCSAECAETCASECTGAYYN